MEKVRFHPNGQWELKKYDEKSYSHIHDTHTSIPTGDHTVEIHPHIDHLMNIKGAITDSGKDKLKVSHLKDMGFDKKHLQKLNVPRDTNGHVTADMIDKHIDSLPKQKVNIKVAPYNLKAQQHRDGQQHVVSVQLHEDTINSMSKDNRTWHDLDKRQHKFEGIDDKNQVGWARIDPKGLHWHIDEIQSDFNNEEKINNNIPKKHFDSDIRSNINHKKSMDSIRWTGVSENLSSNYEKGNLTEQAMNHPAIKDIAKLEENLMDAYEKHGGKSEEHKAAVDKYYKAFESLGILKPHSEYVKDHYQEKKDTEKYNSQIEGLKVNSKNMLSVLSHGHDDPQHMIHSAVNQLARKYNVQSMSMDTPQDQARQSWLRAEGNNNEMDSETVWQAIEAGDMPQGHERNLANTAENFMEEHGDDIHFKSLQDKLGTGAIRDIASSYATNNGADWKYYGNTGGHSSKDKEILENISEGKKKDKYTSPETAKTMLSASDQELNAFSSFLERIHEYNQDKMYDHIGQTREKSDAKIKLPVHQMDTYNKRPKKLGMKPHDKSKVLGEDEEDKQTEVQYHKLHKSLLKLKKALKNVGR